jgi:hypothetical protein
MVFKEVVINGSTIQDLKERGTKLSPHLEEFLQFLIDQTKEVKNCLKDIEYFNNYFNCKGHRRFLDHITSGTNLSYYVIENMNSEQYEVGVFEERIKGGGEKFLNCIIESKKYKGFLYRKINHVDNFKYIISEIIDSVLYLQKGDSSKKLGIRFGYRSTGGPINCEYLVIYANENGVKMLIDCFKDYLKNKEEKKEKKEEPIMPINIINNNINSSSGIIFSDIKNNTAIDSKNVEINQYGPPSKEDNTLLSTLLKIWKFICDFFSCLPS